MGFYGNSWVRVIINIASPSSQKKKLPSSVVASGNEVSFPESHSKLEEKDMHFVSE